MHPVKGAALGPADGQITLTVKLGGVQSVFLAHTVFLHEHLNERRTCKAHELVKLSFNAHFAQRILNAFCDALGSVENSAVKVKENVVFHFYLSPVSKIVTLPHSLVKWCIQ